MAVDFHRCGNCQKEFDTYENFLIHKLLIEQYKLIIEPSDRIPGLRLPKFIKPHKQPSGPVDEPNIPSSDDSEIPSLTATADAADSSSTPVTTAVSNDKEKAQRQEERDSEKTVEVDSTANQEVDVESDDNVSVSSRTESLRIDESAKDNLSSPMPDRESEFEPDQKVQVYCKQCDRYYKNKVVLRVHEETVHSSERPHTCACCHQAFKTKGSLVRHMRTHTGERPFRCNECGRAFHYSASLSRHIHRLHRNLPGKRQPNHVQIFITRLVSGEKSQSQSADTENS